MSALTVDVVRSSQGRKMRSRHRCRKSSSRHSQALPWQHRNSMINLMSTTRLTVSLPLDVARQMRDAVEAGRAESISALVCEAVTKRLRVDHFDEVLAQAIEEAGPPTEEDLAWVRRALGR